MTSVEAAILFGVITIVNGYMIYILKGLERRLDKLVDKQEKQVDEIAKLKSDVRISALQSSAHRVQCDIRHKAA